MRKFWSTYAMTAVFSLCIIPLALAQTQITFLGTVGGKRLQTLRQIVAGFEADHSEYKVNIVTVGGWKNMEDRALAMIAGGAPPDLMWMGETGGVTSFAAAGLLQELSPFVDAAGLDLRDFFPSILDMGRYDGGLYAIPINSLANIMYYNRDMLNSVGLEGPAQTQEELLTYARHLKNLVDDYPPVRIVTPSYSLKDFGTWAFPRGAEFSRGGAFLEPTFNSPDMVGTLEFLVEARQQGLLGDPNASGFYSAQVAVTTALPILVHNTESRNVAFDRIAGLTPDGGAGPISWAWGHYLAIPAGAANKDAAWELALYLLSPEVSPSWHQGMNYLPARRSVVVSDTYYLNHPIWRVYFEQLQQSRALPVTPFWQDIQSIFSSNVGPAWRGEESPAAVLDRVQEQAVAYFAQRAD